MEPVFDRNRIAENRRRARRIGGPGADFLVRHAAGDLAVRLAGIERHFSSAAVLEDDTGQVAHALAKTGKTGDIGQCGLSQDSPDGLERLDLEPASVDLVVSALSLHLTNDTPGALIQIFRSLKPDGLFLAAIPASGTLQELRESLLVAETELTGGASPRVAPFADVREYGALLQRAGFALPVADVEPLTVRYDTLFDLMRDLRAMGMANPLAARSRRPVRRDLFARAAAVYAERFADADGRIRASFPMVFLSGWSPHASQQKPLRPGSAKARLADALKTTEKKI